MLETRRATGADAAVLVAMIGELADYEQLAHQLSVSEERLQETLFGDQPWAFCDIAFWAGEAAGFCAWFYNFSTFEGRHGIYVEDVFVRPAYRRRGIATALLSARASDCVAQGLTRLEWRLLAWNRPAIDFFAAHGIEVTNDWRFGRAGPASISALAGGAGQGAIGGATRR